MSYNFNSNQDLEPFEVSKELLRKVRQKPLDVNSVDGYQGHPIKGIGDVYTPESIVNYILDSIDYTPSADLEDRKIVDLSCGTGSFVREIVRRLRTRLIDSGLDPTEEDDADEIISTVEHNVYAFDLNSIAVWRTAQVVVNELSTELEKVSESDPLAELNIYHANSLLPQTDLGGAKFDNVVGNPPYIKNKEIDSELDEIYRKEYDTAIGKYDQYSLFIEKGIELLEEGGRLGVVVPNRFFWTDYGKPLRKLLTTETDIGSIINMRNNPFDIVSAYPIILVANKKKQRNSILQAQVENSVLYCDVDSNELEYLRARLDQGRKVAELNECAIYKQSELEEGPWNFLPGQIKDLKLKINEKLRRDFKSFPINIRAGIATGADDVFIIDRKKVGNLEDDLLIPIIRGKDIGKGVLEWDNTFLICPYRTDGSIINLENYPQTKRYLSKHEDRLRERFCVTERGKRWYETHDTIDVGLETKERIVTPDITSRTRFSLVEGYISHNSCYSIYFEGELRPLLGYMNSKVFEFMLKSSLPEMKSGHWRQMKRDLKELPVLDPSLLDESNKKHINELVDNRKWAEVDKEIYNFLNLNTDQIKSIESYIE